MPYVQRQFVFLLLVACPCLSQTASNAPIDQRVEANRVRLSEILMSTPQPYDPAQVAEARRTAEEAHQALWHGQAFADLARNYSDGPSAAQGGDVGCFVPGNLAPVLEKVAFQMMAGDTSEVIRIKQGFVILAVTGRGLYACDPLQVLNQPRTAELDHYAETFSQRVRKKWMKLIPKSVLSPEFRQGSVVIEFSVQRNGVITDQKVALTSGYSDLDDAALAAIRDASPLPPLPSTIKGDHLVLRFRFQYNSNESGGP